MVPRPVGQPGCIMAPWGSGVNSEVVAISADTWVQAGRDMTLQLGGDLTIVADSIGSTHGMKVVCSDGNHTLRLPVPGTAQTCVAGHDITLVGGTTASDAIVVPLFTPGKIVTNGPTDLRGKLTAGCPAANRAGPHRARAHGSGGLVTGPLDGPCAETGNDNDGVKVGAR